MIKPKGDVTRSSTPRRAYASFLEPQVEICAWYPDANAQLPPEQVHFIIHWPAGMQLTGAPPLAIRFKSPDTLGFFIEELTRYRRVVWPDCEPVEGEKNAKL